MRSDLYQLTLSFLHPTHDANDHQPASVAEFFRRQFSHAPISMSRTRVSVTQSLKADTPSLIGLMMVDDGMQTKAEQQHQPHSW